MIDKRILQALENPSPSIRRKAITALGKSADADALPILANIYRTDPDPELRDLARKAGVYIKQQGSDSQPVSKPPSKPRNPDEVDVESIIAASKTARQAEEKAREPVKKIPRVLDVDLSTLNVSGANVERAKAEMDKAMYFSVQGEMAPAKIALQKAFTLNPHLRVDNYARSLVLQIAGGVDEEQALYDLMMEEVKIPKKESEGGGKLFVLLMLIAGGLMLAGFFLPWLQSPDDANLLAFEADVVEAEGQDAYSGLDIVQNTDDIAVTLSQLAVLADLLRGNFSLEQPNRNPITYSPALTAVAGGLQILLGLLVFLGGGGKGWYWFQGILMTLAGGAGLLWMYTTVNDFAELLNLIFGGIMTFSAMDLLGTGFLLSAGGAGLLALASILGLLTSGGKR